MHKNQVDCIAQFVGTDAENLCLTESTTHSINSILMSVPLKAGDTILVCFKRLFELASYFFLPLYNLATNFYIFNYKKSNSENIGFERIKRYQFGY